VEQVLHISHATFGRGFFMNQNSQNPPSTRKKGEKVILSEYLKNKQLPKGIYAKGT